MLVNPPVKPRLVLILSAKIQLENILSLSLFICFLFDPVNYTIPSHTHNLNPVCSLVAMDCIGGLGFKDIYFGKPFVERKEKFILERKSTIRTG